VAVKADLLLIFAGNAFVQIDLALLARELADPGQSDLFMA
jgi:hypothetical protein